MTTEPTVAPTAPVAPEGVPLAQSPGVPASGNPQSLMDYVPATTETLTRPQEGGIVQAPSDNTQEAAPWYYAEGKAGEGPRPEYLLDKYSSLDAQAKGYQEIFEKLSGHQGAPAEYNIEFLKETGVPIDPNQPILKEFMEMSKDENISQKYFQKAMECYTKLEKLARPNLEEERAKLGVDGAEKMATIRQWAINTLPADEADAICYAATSASFVRALDRLRNSSQPIAIPTNPNLIPKQGFAPSTESQLYQEYMVDNYDKYGTDENYRKEYTERLELAIRAQDRQP